MFDFFVSFKCALHLTFDCIDSLGAHFSLHMIVSLAPSAPCSLLLINWFVLSVVCSVLLIFWLVLSAPCG